MGIERVKFRAKKVLWGNPALDLGMLAGAVEVTIEPEQHEVKDDRVGDEPLALILKSSKVKIKASFQEIDQTFYEKLLDGFGLAATTPSKEGATKVIANGTGLNGTNMSSNAKRLVLKAMGSTDSDHSDDICFWKAVPKLSGALKYSGSDQHNVEIEFTVIPDETKPSNVNKFVMGDYTQFEA